MENLAINARKKITMDKYFSQVKVVVPNNIKNIVNVSVRSDVISNEIANSFLIVNGKLYVDVVYISDENEIESVSNIIDFVEKQKVNLMISDLCANDCVKAENITFSSSEVMFTVVHQTDVYGVYKYLVGEYSENKDEFVLQEKCFECVNLIASGEDRFVVAEELESNIENAIVLSNSAKIIIGEIASALEKVVIDGKVIVSTFYKDSDGIGECHKEIEFRQEIAVKQALPGMFANAVVRVSNIAVTPEQKEDKTVMTYVIDLFTKTYLYEATTVRTYDDIFSLENELVPTYDYLELSLDDGYKYEQDVILMQTDISKLEDFDDIVGVYLPKIEVVELVDNAENASILSKISAVGVYKTSKGLEKMDLSYDIKFDTDKEITKNMTKVIPTVSISSFKVKAGKDLEISFSIGYKMMFEKTECDKYVKSYEIKSPKELDRSAVKVYITKSNQSVFDVAKAINVRPEVILEQNEIDDVFDVEQKVYVYSPILFN